MNDLIAIFEQLANRRDLTRDQSRWTFERIMAGAVDPSMIGALLGALKTKGECVDELVGSADAMRANVVPIRCDADCIDTCGTGGDGISTFNVSTTAAIIAASAGATVAKHGNRSTSRVSGSTEALDHLGIDTEASTDVVERSLREVRIGYLNARTLHPTMKHAAPVRKTLGVRTIFNLLGPLTNPAGARRQVLGVPQPEIMDKMAEALLMLGAEHAWIVHGDGLCDLTVTGTTLVVEVVNGGLNRFEVTPEDVHLRRATMNELLVRSPEQSAETVRAILRGQTGPTRDQALMNAGAAMVVAGQATNLADGVARAARAVDDGSAFDTLERWKQVAGTGAGRATRDIES